MGDSLPSASWAASLGDGVHGADEAAAAHALFASLAASEEFAKQTWARRPVLMPAVPGIANLFTLEHLATAVDDDFLDAGRGVAENLAGSGWKMAPVSEPRGASFEDAKMRYVDVEKAMKSGTVVFNSAGAHIPRLGTLCLAALDAFGLPNCLNLYVTGKGTATSAPPHTDKQDVFVLQSVGAKRWRVYEPPPPAVKPRADPLARGKAHDGLSLNELGAPLIDTVLKPGEVLYMPAGFPHATDTVNTASAGVASQADSLHLTIGLDTHIWGLDYAGLRSGALDRAGLPNALVETTLRADVYWQLMKVPANLGFLCTHAAAEGIDAYHGVAAELVQCARASEPKRWEGQSDDEIMTSLGATAVAEQAVRHTARIIDVQRAMYLDAAKDVRLTAPGAPRVSLFRVQEHMSRLESCMDEHLRWYGPEAVKRATASAAVAAGVSPPSKPQKASIATAGRAGRGGGVGGFGGAGGGAKPKAKKSGKKGRRK